MRDALPARDFRLPALALPIVLGLAVLPGLALAPAAAAAVARPAAVAPSGQSAPLPVCRYADLTAPAAGYDDWQRTLVDTIYRLPPGYAPPDLVDVTDLGVGGPKQVRSFVVDDLRQMAGAAKEAGVQFAVLSAYRSEDRQVQVLASLVSSLGTDAAYSLSARPGHSEHQLGTTVDMTEPPGWHQWQGDWGQSPQGTWLAENSWRYGFVMSYPRDSSPGTTCYEYEPWHFRYFGRETAAAIHDSGLAPRAYLWQALGADQPGTDRPDAKSGGSDPNDLLRIGLLLALGALLAGGALVIMSRRRVRSGARPQARPRSSGTTAGKPAPKPPAARRSRRR